MSEYVQPTMDYYYGFWEDEPDDISHVGKPHDGYVPHSGRYPWGSGKNAYQRAVDFQSHVLGLRNKGWSLNDIAAADNMTLKQLRARASIAESVIRRKLVAENRHLAEKGWSRAARARKFGVNESSIREWEKEDIQKRKDEALNTADMLAEQVKNYKYVEVGKGIEKMLGVSATKLNYALQALEDSGKYTVQDIYVDQNTTGKRKQTRIQVLVPADTPKSDIYNNKDKIAIPTKGVYKEDDTWERVEKPVHIDPKRVYVKYTEDDHKTGGIEKDGIIELRRGVDDISLGKAMYAQVRIAVGKDKYMKGVAIYSDDIPDGYDIVYNTNKTRSQADKVFKDMNKNADGSINYANPFGATIKTNDNPSDPDRDLIRCQRHYTDANGKRRQSALNIVNEEGDWQDWGRTLSSQFLSKQSLDLARRQLKIMYDRKVDEFKEIMGLTNPTIKAELLKGFADDCDSSAAHLKAAPIPGSAAHVIIPLGIRADEIFAPNYEDGSTVVLIRYPHAGPFEAAQLKVNNRNREGLKVIGKDSPDAVGINKVVAEKMSGADFDGDTVMVIPNNDGAIRVDKALSQLRDYEPKILYAKPEGSIKTGLPKHGESKYDKDGNLKYDGFDTQRQMGEVSNLITDMTLKKAPIEDIALAVRHSMTVIDAEKHNLDWQQSMRDNRIRELKAHYQGINSRGQLHGASTLISKAKGKVQVPERREGDWIVDENGVGHRVLFDPETGKKLYQPTGRTYQEWDKEKKQYKPQIKTAMEKITNMENTDDALTLSSGTAMERVYGMHANRLKSLANEARKEYMHTEDVPYNSAAARRYDDQVKSLEAKYNRALEHKPFERRAVALADSLLQMKMAEDPTLRADSDRKKKEHGRLMVYARAAIGHKRPLVNISEKEYEAIQAGAVHKTFLKNLMKEADMDALKRVAMPKKWSGMSPSKLAKARTMLRNGGTQLEVAQAMGVSVTTLQNALKGDL